MSAVLKIKHKFPYFHVPFVKVTETIHQKLREKTILLNTKLFPLEQYFKKAIQSPKLIREKTSLPHNEL